MGRIPREAIQTCLGLILDGRQVGSLRDVQQCTTKESGEWFHDVRVSDVHPGA